ncbi:hypothetical protein CR513_33401, partial [Mucuna pruriens]
MKQLATSNLEFQQSVSSSNMQFQQNVTATIQDLKTQIGQLANTVSQLQSARSSNLPSQTIPNLRRNASVITLRSGKELPQPTLQQSPRSTKTDFEPNVDSQSRIEKTVPMPFPTRTISTRRLELDEELKIFQKVEVPKYAKFLKELCIHKRKKTKGNREIRGVVSALTRNEELTIGAQALPKKYKDPRIFSVPCTIGKCTFVDAMLDLGASINVMPASIYRSIVQPLGVLEDVLVQVIELIFLADFYVLDMEDETSGKESTLILGRPFLMTARMKIDVHAGMLSMEFGDTLVQFNIFEAIKHPTEDHSLFGIDLINELVEEYLQLDSSSEDIVNLAGSTDQINCLGPFIGKADYRSEPKAVQEANADSNSTSTELTKASRPRQPKAEIMSTHLVPSPNQVGQMDSKSSAEKSSSPPPPMELKPLSNHLKYAYLDKEQQLPVIIANNLHQEQEDKLLEVLRQHKRAMGWKLSDLPSINPSICMHRIMMEEEIKPIRQQQRRLNLTLLDVVKKEVTKLLAAGIIYPISDSQWVSPVQVVPKKSGMTVAKDQHDKRLNQAIRKDHFPLPFIDQVLEKLVGKSHYCFLDGFSDYMKIHIAPKDQYKTTFTCPFGTFVYTCMPFGLCNALGTF